MRLISEPAAVAPVSESGQAAVSGELSALQEVLFAGEMRREISDLKRQVTRYKLMNQHNLEDKCRLARKLDLSDEGCEAATAARPATRSTDDTPKLQALMAQNAELLVELHNCQQDLQTAEEAAQAANVCSIKDSRGRIMFWVNDILADPEHLSETGLGCCPSHYFKHED